MYRSGESEYLLNGTPVRLKDVNELFYDTGIGKEGYSIIGQGQIEKILSGKPEERRELFDEAVGIVKYKKRKSDALKKLASEHDDLTRVNDILSELEKQVGPLKEESDTAKRYLQKKEELKKLDANLYLVETAEKKAENDRLSADRETAEADLSEQKKEDERIRRSYDALDGKLTALDEEIEALRRQKDENVSNRGKLSQQISVLTERISAGEKNGEGYDRRLSELENESSEKEAEKNSLTAEKESLDQALSEVEGRLKQVEAEYNGLEEEIRTGNARIEENKNALLTLLKERGELKSRAQRGKTLLEQMNIRKAGLNKQFLEQKTYDDAQQKELAALKKACDEADRVLADLQQKAEDFRKKQTEWAEKKEKSEHSLADLVREESVLSSNLEILENMAERYEGFGNSVRKVMENRDTDRGIIGTVSDLISADRKYETAIETALGGNIKNIVTEDE